MPQDRTTGAAGNAFGHECGEKFAAVLGAVKLKKQSNECLLSGDRIVIKCAHQKTTSVGVLYDMLERLDAIVGAFEQKDGSYSLIRLSAKAYKGNTSVTQSHSRSAGRVGVVPRSVFYKDGTRIRSVHL